MNKFNVGDRVVLTGAGADAHFGLSAGMAGVVDRLQERLDGSAVRVRMSDGRLFWFRPDQLDHTPREALADGPSLRERRERIATAVLAGFATVPNAFADTTVQAIRSVQWADALIKELDK